MCKHLHSNCNAVNSNEVGELGNMALKIHSSFQFCYRCRPAFTLLRPGEFGR
jgi:hypothetical protein